MFQPWRTELRKAERALAQGSLEEALEILRDNSELREFSPAASLSQRIAKQFVERGKMATASGDSTAGWRDWEAAADLAADLSECRDFQRELLESSIEEAGKLLRSGDPTAARDRLDRLIKRGLGNRQVRLLLQTSRHWEMAEQYAKAGRYGEAELEFGTAVALGQGFVLLEQRRDSCRSNAAEARVLTERLHEAMSQKQWTDVQTLAQRLLELAPEFALARNAQRRAWNAVSPEASRRRSPRPVASAVSKEASSSNIESPGSEDSGVPSKLSTDKRLVLWIDAVGGVLVCTGDELVIGQPVAGTPVDIPILADLSRRHAVIRRESQGYVLVAKHKTSVNGRPVEGSWPLTDGALIELGAGVRLRFRQPHALSNSARLDFVSRHRTKPAVDGILLMSDTCILGPKKQSHVVCRNWKHDVVLFRRGDELYCRAAGEFEVDGRPARGNTLISPSSTVQGEDFSFSYELL